MLGKLKYAFTCNPIAQTLLEWTLESAENLCYFKLRLFDLIEYTVWNILRSATLGCKDMQRYNN